MFSIKNIDTIPFCIEKSVSHSAECETDYIGGIVIILTKISINYIFITTIIIYHNHRKVKLQCG